MPTVDLTDAQARLPDLIAELRPGDEVTIVRGGEELATLTKTPPTPLSPPKRWPCKAGSYRKAEFRMSPDFDAPLEEFWEYME